MIGCREASVRSQSWLVCLRVWDPPLLRKHRPPQHSHKGPGLCSLPEHIIWVTTDLNLLKNK